MKARLQKLRRIWYGVAAASITVISMSPLFNTQVFAYGQVATRSIQMSSAVAGATGTTYQIKFNTATAGVIEGIVINFCDNNPLISASCTYTSGQSADPSGATFTSITGTPDTTIGASNWKISANANSATAGNGTILALTDANATENSSITAGTTITAIVGGITNPNYSSCGSPDPHPNCTFYARILTYTTPAGATGYQSQTIGSPTDAGGIALSTTSQIAITANVMEQITFCVSGNSALVSGGAHGCTNAGDVTNPALTIGHGSGTLIIDNTAVDVASAYTQLSTNASQGVIVRMKSNNTCGTGSGGLSSSGTGGATCGVPGIGAHAVMTAGTADFGMCVAKGTNTTLATNYNDTVNNCPSSYNATSLYGMVGANVQSTYGDQIFNTTGAVTKENNTLTFAATAATTTPAGIYTVGESLIATGTY